MSSDQQALDLARQLWQSGQWQQAEQLCLRALEAETDRVDALLLLAAIAGKTGRQSKAIECFQRVLRLKPGLAGVHYNLGNAYMMEGKFAEAVGSFQEAVRLEPGFAMAHNNLGYALRLQKRRAEAVASFQEAVRLQPGSVVAHTNLGSALFEQGRLAEAETSLRQALRIQPDHAEAHMNLGNLFKDQERLDEAVASYQQALRAKPDYADAHVNLGIVLRDQGRPDDAVAELRAALRIKPEAHIHSVLIITLNYHPDYDARAIFEECRRWNLQHAEPLKKLILPHGNHPDPQRRLRVGYVSPHFRTHVDTFFMVPLLSNHDHRRFEIFCYAGVEEPDNNTHRLRGYADVWRDTVGLSDQQVAEWVRADHIDILVDLEFHAPGNRLLLFARKPAPVQVAWLGYPGTTGLSTIDYRLTDPHLDPPGLFDDFYAEQSVRLAETFWCYDPLTDQPSVNLLPALEHGVFTFGSLNGFSKINDECLALWAKVLRAVPRSRLVLLAARGQTRERARAKLEQEGIAGTRVEFVDKRPRLEYLEQYHQIDLGLDPLPYNGHTTSLDAFWMGVPTLTLLGKTAAGRAGWSQLCNLGLEELAAQTPQEYVALAARLAADLPHLRELRSTLRERMQRSALMDGKLFAGRVEAAYRDMWGRWCLENSKEDSTNDLTLFKRVKS